MKDEVCKLCGGRGLKTWDAAEGGTAHGFPCPRCGKCWEPPPPLVEMDIRLEPDGTVKMIDGTASIAEAVLEKVTQSTKAKAVELMRAVVFGIRSDHTPMTDGELKLLERRGYQVDAFSRTHLTGRCGCWGDRRVI